MESGGKIGATQNEVFRLAAAGDRDAFTSVVRGNQSLVFSLAWNFLHNEAAAEELAQEVFLELFRVLPTLESPAHVTNWLRRVTTHRCIDQSRRDRHRPRLTLEEVDEPSESPHEPDFFLRDRLRRLTAALPERARAVVVLRYQEDLEPAEISQVLGIPVNTVKSHLQRALATLREKLERTKVRQ
jgi:RNA polymerase sigma-70 factor (ECF subfamily)